MAGQLKDHLTIQHLIVGHHHSQHHRAGKRASASLMRRCRLVPWFCCQIWEPRELLVWAQLQLPPLRKAWLDSGKTREQGGPVDVGRVIPRCPVRQGGHTQMSSNRVEATLILVPIAHPPVSERLPTPCLLAWSPPGRLGRLGLSLAANRRLLRPWPRKKAGPPSTAGLH